MPNSFATIFLILRDDARFINLSISLFLTCLLFKYFIFFFLDLLKKLNLRKSSFWRLRSVILNRRRFWLSINSSKSPKIVTKYLEWNGQKYRIWRKKNEYIFSYYLLSLPFPLPLVIFLLSSKLKNKIPCMKLTYEIWLLFHPRMEKLST